MSFQPLYTATAHAHGGREGRVHVENGPIDLALTVPKGLGGPGTPGANPEMLFAAGYAACFEGALRLVARTRKISVPDVAITCLATIGKTDAGGYGLAVELRGSFSGVDRETAEQLMAGAHQVCPYSQATRGNIEVKLEVTDPSPAA